MNIGYLYHATEAARDDNGNKLDIAEYIRRECERNAKHYRGAAPTTSGVAN